MTLTVITCVYHEKIIRRDRGDSGAITIAFWLIMINLRAFVILLECFVKQGQHLKIMNSFRDVEKMFENIIECRVRCQFIKSVCHKFIILSIIELVTIFTIPITSAIRSGNSVSMNFWIVYSFPYVFTRLGQMQIMTYIFLVRQNVLMLSEYSQKMAKIHELPKGKLFAARAVIKVQKWPTNGHFAYQMDETVIFRVQKIHRSIWECSVIVNDIAYWSTPIAIFNDFFILLFNTFWFVVFLLDDYETPNEVFLFLVLWIFSTLKTILFTTINCEVTKSAVSQFSGQ